ncbi:MAG: hypothetical protein GDA56_12560 [Hormoscilla sp. GM7CHS1pb]|nr:hypothetical protein [Hormoscilla sp. GM7CHS1pb]
MTQSQVVPWLLSQVRGAGVPACGRAGVPACGRAGVSPARVQTQTRFVLTTNLEHFPIEGDETSIQLIGCHPVNHA